MTFCFKTTKDFEVNWKKPNSPFEATRVAAAFAHEAIRAFPCVGLRFLQPSCILCLAAPERSLIQLFGSGMKSQNTVHQRKVLTSSKSQRPLKLIKNFQKRTRNCRTSPIKAVNSSSIALNGLKSILLPGPLCKQSRDSYHSCIHKSTKALP